MNRQIETFCFHCGSGLSSQDSLTMQVRGATHRVCCRGCEAAANLIVSQGLERFYEFRSGGSTGPVDGSRDWSAFDRDAALRRYTHLRADGERELSLQIDNVQCAACAWLIDSSLARLDGVCDVHVNPGTARAEVRFDPRRATLSGVLGRIHALGYLPNPLSFTAEDAAGSVERRAALTRLAVAGFGMMQVMTYAVSLYAGALQGMSPGLEQLLRFVSLLVTTPVVLYSAQPFFAAALRGLRSRTLNMDLPVALSIVAAYLWSVGATLLGRGPVYFDSVVMFTFFLLLGRYVEMSLRHRAGMQHDALTRLLPAGALRIRGAHSERVTPDELLAGDCVRVLAGERVPADGLIQAGFTEVDESLLTGESEPRTRARGDAVIAGTLNVGGPFDMNVTAVGQDSTLAAVSRQLERARAERPHVAELADRVAAWFVAGILAVAAGVGLYWWHFDAARAFPAVLAVLVVTCPCALSLATPAAIAAATTRLARGGLLIMRPRALERLADADSVIFDKTGTLTRGQPRIDEVRRLRPGIGQARCLEIMAALERHSEHPIARAFRHIEPAANVGEVRVAVAQGIEGVIDGVHYRLGRPEYVLSGCGAAAGPEAAARSGIVLGDDGGLVAEVVLRDGLREDVPDTFDRLRALGLDLCIASGDQLATVTTVARRLGLCTLRGDMQAAEKLAFVRTLQTQGRRVAMVGDGINDAPVLAGADVSIAIASGTDLAKVSADLVLLGEGLSPLVDAIRCARRTHHIIRQNLAWAILYNATAVPLAASGTLQPWIAAIGMSASSVLVVLNAMRLLRGDRATPVAQGSRIMEAIKA